MTTSQAPVVHLVYEYTIQEADGCGTQNDAYITAIRRLISSLECADSTDDAINVFTKVEIK